MTQAYIKPFLKWPGGKFRVLPHIHPALPQGKRLVEPFLGSGAVFLNCDYPQFLLNDINPDLINLYKLIQQKGDDFIRRAKRYFSSRYNTPQQYYRLRAEFNRSRDTVKKSLLFLYLNRHAYNGLCRYNKKGEFNVPFGRYKKPYFPQIELQHFAEKCQRARFFCLPFETFMKKARAGDVVYCDPPYVPLNQTSSFTSYAPKGFDLTAQHTLAACAKDLAAKRLPVIISNHDTELTRELYQHAAFRHFKVRRSISCMGKKREQVGELLAIY